MRFCLLSLEDLKKRFLKREVRMLHQEVRCLPLVVGGDCHSSVRGQQEVRAGPGLGCPAE